jgi:hypothetical protein
MSARRSPRVFAPLLLGGLVVIVFLLQLLPSGGGSRAGSVFSTGDEGRRAAFRLLAELGFEPRAWTRAPGHLPRGSALLVLPAVPEESPGLAERDGASEEERGPDMSATRRLRDPLHYLRFVEEGGTVLAGLEPAMRAFLGEALGFTEIEELADPPESEASGEPTHAVLVGGEQVELAGPSARAFAPLRLASPFHALATTADGRPLVVQLRRGRGSLVLLLSDRLLENRSIGALDHAVLLVRLVERQHDPGTPLLFDEYALGGWVPESPIELAFAPGHVGFTLHLLLLGAVLLWRASWVRAFPRDPEPLGLLAPLERARAHAGLLVEQGRFDLLARLLRDGVLRRLGGGRASREERSPSDELEIALRPLAPRLGGREGLARARALFDRTVDGEGELERLGRDFAELERIAGIGRHAARGGRGGSGEEEWGA